MKTLARRRTLIGLTVLAAAFATGAAQAQDKKGWPQRLTIATGPVGGYGYTTGSPWATTVGNAVGIPISPETSGGFSISAQMVHEKKVEVGITTTSVGHAGWNGEAWAKGTKMQNMRALAIYTPNVMQIYTLRKNNATSLSDLAGKSINPSRRRSGTDILLRDMSEVLGIKPGRISNVSPADANQLLGDGRLDFGAVTGSIPHPAVSEFEVNNDMVMIGFSEDQQKKFLAARPAFSPYTIKANSYKGQTEPVRTVADYVMYVVHKDLPDSLVYEMVKANFGKKADLAAAHKSFGLLDPKDITVATIPVHPGAVKWYKEQGIAAK